LLRSLHHFDKIRDGAVSRWFSGGFGSEPNYLFNMFCS
jgi:hypothetical protein